jgi:hypothetical protein
VAWAGLVLSLISLTWGGYETHKNNRLSHQAFVRAKVVFPIDARNRLNAVARDAEVTMPMEALLLNHGNSVANDIVFESLIKFDGKVLSHFSERVTITDKKSGESVLTSIEPGDEQPFPLAPLKMKAGDLLDSLEGRGRPLTICTGVSFRDEYHSELGRIHCTIRSPVMPPGF